jgi:hypothetical protein
MVHPDCTTAIESLLLGKKAFSLLPEKYDNNLVTLLPVLSSEVYFNYHDLVNTIKNNKYLDIINSNKDTYFLEEYFSVSKDSSQTFVNLVNSIPEIKKNKTIHNSSFMSRIVMSTKTLINRSKILSPSNKLYSNKLNGLNIKHIRNIAKNICLLNPELNNVNIKTISVGLYLFNNH